MSTLTDYEAIIEKHLGRKTYMDMKVWELSPSQISGSDGTHEAMKEIIALSGEKYREYKVYDYFSRDVAQVIQRLEYEHVIFDRLQYHARDLAKSECQRMFGRDSIYLDPLKDEDVKHRFMIQHIVFLKQGYYMDNSDVFERYPDLIPYRAFGFWRTTYPKDSKEREVFEKGREIYPIYKAENLAELEATNKGMTRCRTASSTYDGYKNVADSVLRKMEHLEGNWVKLQEYLAKTEEEDALEPYGPKKLI